jgi:hypothetical protein
LYYSSVAGNRFSQLQIPCRTQDIANLANTLTASGVTANGQLGSVSRPANAYLLYALFRETAGENVSVAIGTTLGASDVMAAVEVLGQAPRRW